MRTVRATVAFVTVTLLAACNAMLGNESHYDLVTPPGAGGTTPDVDASHGGGGGSGTGGAGGNVAGGGTGGGTVTTDGGNGAGGGGILDASTDANPIRTDAGGGDGTAIGSIGDPCSPNNSYACTGHAKKGVVVCSKGTWSGLPQCSGSDNCDTSPGANAGSCQPIVAECVGKTAGTSFCRGTKDRYECGIDLVTATLAETCPYVCTNGACTGECDPTGTVTKQCKSGTTNVPQTCDATTGTWKDQTQCSYLCTAGDCVAASCGDGVLNGTETDKDCGGGCGGCDVGLNCKVDGDCKLPVSGKCSGGKCIAAQCNDGVQNGSETALDCGGGCPNACAVGAGCSVNADCKLPDSGRCLNSKCAAATCIDSVQNGSETGPDCGGTCPNNCGVGSGCLVDTDCAASACVNKVCTGVCSPGTKQCAPGGANGSQTCSAQGQWGATVACAGTQVCSAGTCSGCPSGRLDCNGLASDGCEKVTDSPTSCGTTCATIVCSSANGTPTCVNGVCGANCNNGFGNCSTGANDGCETNLNSSATCGAACGSTVACGIAAPTCSSGSCVCPVGYSVSNGVCCQSGKTGCGGACVDLQTDGANCGGCGLLCPSGCASGHCVQALATGEFSQGIAADSNFVYWSNLTGNRIMRAPVGGGTAVTLAAAPSVSTPFQIAIDSAYVYWTNQGNNTIMRVPIVGGLPTTLATGQTSAAGIAVDATNVYWTAGGSPSGWVAKVAIGGGSVFTMAANQDGPSYVAVNAVSAFFTRGGSTVGDGSVNRVGIGGGAVSTLVSGLVEPGSIAINSTTMFVATSGSTKDTSVILSAPIVGGIPTPIASAQGYFYDGMIAIDATSVYWANFQDGNVAKVALGGGTVVTLGTVANPMGVALAGSSVFFSAYGGTVGKITPR